MSKIKSKFKEMLKVNNSICKDTVMINMNRLLTIAFVAIPVSFLHVVMFLIKNPTTEAEEAWRLGIIVSHLSLMGLMIIVGLIGLYVKKHPNVFKRAYGILQYFLVGVVFTYGIIITMIDQLVVTNVTPFIVASIVVALVFYIRPLASTIIYIVSGIVFVILIRVNIDDAAIALTNQVNGITITGLGLLISNLLWTSKSKEILQARKIEDQQAILLKTNEQLDYLATHDQQTHLLNRMAFMQTVEGFINKGSLLAIDIDFFKKVNDEYGHPIGDLLIKAFADELRLAFGSESIVSRFGGEEFLVWIPQEESDATELANMFKNHIETRKFKLDTVSIKIQISIGVTKLNNDFNEAYKLADQALYEAKDTGRNKVVYKK